MIVTVILSILALIAVRPLREARQNAMVAAAKSEVREVSGALSRHQVVTGLLPDNVGALESAGYTPSREVEICAFLPRVTNGRVVAILIQGRHVRGDRVASVEYPDGAIVVLERGGEQASCAP